MLSPRAANGACSAPPGFLNGTQALAAALQPPPPNGFDVLWSHLWDRLKAWLRRIARNLHDLEDIVGDTVCRALARFGLSPPPWGDLWAWSRRIARNRLTDLWRARCRECVDGCSVRDAIVRADGPVPACVQLVLTKLRPLLAPSERVILAMLEAGMTNNRRIADELGLTVDAVKKARRRIRQKAAHSGIPPESVPPDRLVLCRP